MVSTRNLMVVAMVVAFGSVSGAQSQRRPAVRACPRHVPQEGSRCPQHRPACFYRCGVEGDHDHTCTCGLGVDSQWTWHCEEGPLCGL